MGILPNKFLRRDQIIVLTHKATREKMRWTAWRGGTENPHRPYADGGSVKGVLE
jgi:hypothetical protein